jgi:hypothetical protein
VAGTLTTAHNVSTAVKRNRGKLLLIGGAIVVLLAVLVLVFVVPKWPFREADMKKRIANATHSKVAIGHFHQQFFPHPGCVMDDVKLTPDDPDRPEVAIHSLKVEGLYRGLVGSQKHLRALHADGVQLTFKPKGAANSQSESQNSQQQDSQNSQKKKKEAPLIDQVEATNSKIVFMADKKGTEPKEFDVSKLVLKNFTADVPIHYEAVMKIPTPPADVQISGIFGPVSGKIGDAKLQGSFTMKNGDLSKFHSLLGKLSAKGSFDGMVKSFDVRGSTDSPDFGASDTGHSLPLKTEFQAHVNGSNGNVQFQTIHAVLGKTKLVVEGDLQGEHGKTLDLKITSHDGRIEDVMYLFVHDKPPLQGATTFQMHVRLPDEKKPFEQRIEMQAKFGIDNSKFTHADTEQKMSKLSEQAEGKPQKAENGQDQPLVVADLRGNVQVKDGTAKFTQLACSVPGADAKLHGTFNLESHAVNLHGTLRTQVKLSNATTGFKAFIMKVVEFAKQKDKGPAIVPVSITGTTDKPSFSVDAPKEK